MCNVTNNNMEFMILLEPLSLLFHEELNSTTHVYYENNPPPVCKSLHMATPWNTDILEHVEQYP